MTINISFQSEANTPSAQRIQRIAHAGGGFNGLTYTNSIDALNLNAPNYDLFEIDFSFTSDGELVCIHDWEISAKRAFGLKFSEAPSIGQFQELVNNNRHFKNCTVNTLAEWLNNNSNKKIVTDVKEDNLAALSIIAKKIPNFSERIIPQIYQPEEFEKVKNLGYKQIIWTLYRFEGNEEKILNSVKNMNLYAVTMAPHLVESMLARKLLDEFKIQSYVHTINSQDEFDKYLKLGIQEIYTDKLKQFP